MGFRSLLSVGVLITSSLFVGLAHGQSKAMTPQSLTEEMVASLQAVGRPEHQALEQQGRLFASIDRYFDYDALSAAPFKSHRQAFKGKQLATAQATFRKLVQHLTHQSGAQLAAGEVVVAQGRAVQEGCAVDFDVKRPDDDVASRVTFVWQRRPKGWQVVDVAFDGASVSKDYENQFGRILKKDGPQALEKKLKERLGNLESSKP